MDDPQIRTADAIFTDSVNLQHHLSEIERETEGLNELPLEIIEDIVYSSVRLELCYRELKTMNSTGTFFGKHPFIAQKTERERVSDLLRSDPDKYFEERKNIELNITRYNSQINSKKSSAEKKERARVNVEKYEALLQMYKEIFKTVIQYHGSTIDNV